MPPTIVPRESWRALPVATEYEDKLSVPVKYVVFSYKTYTEPCYTFEDCLSNMLPLQQIARVALGMHDIAYNFMLGGDGRVYEGRGWRVAPPKLRKFRRLHGELLLVGCIGDYKDTHLSEDIWYTAYDFLQYGVKMNFIRDKVMFKFRK